MPSTAYDWIDALDRNFAGGIQPLIAYNLEQRRQKERDLLRQQALSDEARQRQERLADVAEVERYQTERDLISARRNEDRDAKEREFRLSMEKAATERAVTMRKEEWQHADQKTKEGILLELKSKADRLGIPPSPTKDFDSSFTYYNQAVNKAESSALVDLVKQGVTLQREFSNLTGSSEQERAALQMNLLLGANYADATKVLTPEEKRALQRDPTAVIAIEDRLAKDKSKKGRAAFDAFDQALNDADTQATAIYAKRPTQNKERLEAIKGLMAEHRAMISSRFKDAVLGPDTITGMFSGILDDIKSKQAPTVRPATERPPPGAILPLGPAAGSMPAVPVPADQMQQLQQRSVPVDEPRFLYQGMGDTPTLNRMMTGGNTIRSATAARFTPPVTTPALRGSDMNPQLQQYLQDQAAAQALMAPTAFPPLRVPAGP